MVFTPRNQDGGCPWCVVEDVTFQRNVVRNSSSGINILGYDDLAPSKQTRKIRISQNLFHDITGTLGGGAWFLLIGNGPADIVVDHNTVDADGTTISYVYGGAGGAQIPGFQFTNNAFRHSDYGMNGADGAFGNGIISMYFPDGIVRGNWLQGGAASRYPTGNYFDGTFASGFVDIAARNYTAASNGPLYRRATDGTNIGADCGSLGPMVMKVVNGEMTRLIPPRNLRMITK